ncbi:MAG: phytoene/squalene synthase family protein [Hormoscilla sp. GM102CHS1]|nr:phytoene/squalene synthase family protein [Hormoscilla sp. GM102CHS1]
MNTCREALKILEETSRTFYIPISGLPDDLQKAVASAYLCMRAIDQIEDHPSMDNLSKSQLLKEISLTLQSIASREATIEQFSRLLKTHVQLLPEVTIRIDEWALLAPETVAPRIWDATAAMADRMAHWAITGWKIDTQTDLDCYTFSVAGAVGLLLSDLWAWYEGTATNRSQAIGFGRGLQAVNILRNKSEDLERGVDFFPNGWTKENMQMYARRNLSLADAYTKSLPKGPALKFCIIPLTLAHATLDVLSLGKPKLSRSEVMNLIEQVMSRKCDSFRQ